MVAAGGDGTLSEVIHGLMLTGTGTGPPSVTCGLIPLGTGNDITTLDTKVVAGKHLEPAPDERLAFWRCREVEVSSHPPLSFHVDGESVEEKPFRRKVRSEALRMIHGPASPALVEQR